MAKRKQATSNGNGTVTAVVDGDSLVITVPLNVPMWSSARGTPMFQTPRGFLTATGQYDGQGVIFTVAAGKSNR